MASGIFRRVLNGFVAAVAECYSSLCMLLGESAGDGPGPQVDTSSGRVCL